MLMAGDPRREDFESKEFEVKNNDQQQIEQKVDQKDSTESS